MKLSTLIIGLIIVTGILVGIGGFYGNLATQYGLSGVKNISLFNVTSDSKYWASNTTDNLNVFKDNLTTQSQSNLRDANIFTGIGYIISAMIIIFTFPITIAAFIGDVSASLGAAGIPIPPWFAAMVIGVVGAYVTFKIIEFFTGREA